MGGMAVRKGRGSSAIATGVTSSCLGSREAAGRQLAGVLVAVGGRHGGHPLLTTREGDKSKQDTTIAGDWPGFGRYEGARRPGCLLVRLCTREW